jgi:plasmid stabilization system protein ParE
MSGYAFHPLAEAELVDAVRYYEQRREGLGSSFLAEVRRCIRLIAANPQIGTVLEDDVRRKTLHRFPYSLLYAQDAATITILAVMHQKRRPDYWRERM